MLIKAFLKNLKWTYFLMHTAPSTVNTTMVKERRPLRVYTTELTSERPQISKSKIHELLQSVKASKLT